MWDALAAARKKQEEHDELLAQLQEEGEKLREKVATEAEAFKQAEAALEEAERRIVRTIQPPDLQDAVLSPAAEPPPAPALSAEGAAALDGLVAQIANLASPATIRDAEEKHREAVAAAELAGRTPPSILEFVLGTLSQEGGRKLELVRFDISKAVNVPDAAAATVPTVAAAHVLPAAAERVTPRPTAIAARPEQPRGEGGLGDNPRMQQRCHKPLSRECARDHAETAAAARRSEARQQLLRGSPVRDPLWAAIHTAALLTSAPAAAPTALGGQASSEDTMNIEAVGPGHAA